LSVEDRICSLKIFILLLLALSSQGQPCHSLQTSYAPGQYFGIWPTTFHALFSFTDFTYAFWHLYVHHL